jgi:hypothetical protein
MASGGLDSTTVTYQLVEKNINIFPLFFDYGQHCVETEWQRVNEVLPKTINKPERNNISDYAQQLGHDCIIFDYDESDPHILLLPLAETPEVISIELFLNLFKAIENFFSSNRFLLCSRQIFN